MRIYDIIRTKRDGGRLSPEMIDAFISGYVGGELADYHAAALVMAIFIRGMETGELAAWTRAMIHSGETLEFPSGGPYLDKHSTGGVGDKISLPLAPLVACLGVRVPMISGRALGHTGGTLDKLESIPGYRVDLSTDEIRQRLDTVGCVITGQTGNLVPADKKLYALRDVTGTVESIPLIASSILSKKYASGVRGLVMDVKTGSGAFMKSFEDSRALASALVDLGAALGMRVHAFVTRMGQPLGTHIGNSLEILESVQILRNEGPGDSTELVERFAAEMLLLGDLADDDEDARAKVRGALADGRALERFASMIEAQGGDPRIVAEPKRLPTAAFKTVWNAPQAGWIADMDTERLGVAACALGAGRVQVTDVVDPAVGFIVRKNLGNRVETDEPILEIRYNDETRLASCLEHLERVYSFSDEPPAQTPLILDEVKPS